MKQKLKKTAPNLVRISYALVFILNVSCALAFFLFPNAYAAAYELSGEAGRVALRGIGVAFLMWNVTYPAVIVNPYRFFSLAVVVLVQQFVGLAGEVAILFGLADGHALLAASIARFIVFDAAGLVLMLASFICFYVCCKDGHGRS